MELLYTSIITDKIANTPQRDITKSQGYILVQEAKEASNNSGADST